MSSTGSADRSISSGISLPQWMKNKVGDKYDLDVTFSPPSEDESYFLIRYPKSMQQPDLGTLCTNKPKVNELKKQDPLPCQRFLAEIQAEGGMMKRSSTAPGDTLQSSGMPVIDENYRKDTMDSGKSLIGVAQDIISSNMLGYRINREIPLNEANVYNHRQRRNSKSLPASPLSSPKTSPKLRRKNPYFSDPFRKSNENFGKSGWLLSNILSQRKSVEDLTSGAESASETESPGTRRKNDFNKVSSILNPEKKTELREMNFWSPTSM